MKTGGVFKLTGENPLKLVKAHLLLFFVHACLVLLLYYEGFDIVS